MPFLKNKDGKASGISVKTRAPDQPSENTEENAGHEECAREILRAIESKDIKALAAALQDIFQIMDSEPHVEGEHVSSHSYDAQNIKANNE